MGRAANQPPPAPRRVSLERGPVELSCLDHGGEGPPVLLLHGLAGHAGEWAGTASWLARGRRVIALDERGHGHSSRCPGDVAPGARIADVAHVIDELAGEPATLVGQSLGADLAFRVAAARPALVRAIVVAEAHPDGDPAGLAAERIAAWFGSWPVPFASRERAVAFFGGGARGEAWADGLARAPGGLVPRFEASVLVRMLREALASERWAEWESIGCPALVVRAGGGDLPEAAIRAMARRARDGCYAEVPRAGHDLHLEAPGAWREAIERFVLTDGTLAT